MRMDYGFRGGKELAVLFKPLMFQLNFLYLFWYLLQPGGCVLQYLNWDYQLLLHSEVQQLLDPIVLKCNIKGISYIVK